MTLNEVIQRLEEVKNNQNVKLRFFDCFGQMFTSYFDVISWRGSYSFPAIVVHPIDYLEECVTDINEVINNLKDVVNSRVIGYKGGEYIIDGDSELYIVSSESVSGNNVVIEEIYDDGFCKTIEETY